MRDEPARNAGVALHRSEVSVPVLATDRQSGDEMVQDEIVKHDDTGATPERVDDPSVGLRVVADMEEGHVGCDRPRSAAADDLDVEQALQCRQQQRGVVRDPGALRRERRVVGDSQLRRRAIVSSQETRRAISLPA